MTTLPRHLVRAVKNLPADTRTIDDYARRDLNTSRDGSKITPDKWALPAVNSRGSRDRTRTGEVGQEPSFRLPQGNAIGRRIFPSLAQQKTSIGALAAHRSAADEAAQAVTKVEELVEQLRAVPPHHPARPRDVNCRIVSGLTAIDALRSIGRIANYILAQWPQVR